MGEIFISLGGKIVLTENTLFRGGSNVLLSHFSFLFSWIFSPKLWVKFVFLQLVLTIIKHILFHICSPNLPSRPSSLSTSSYNIVFHGSLTAGLCQLVVTAAAARGPCGRVGAAHPGLRHDWRLQVQSPGRGWAG